MAKGALFSVATNLMYTLGSLVSKKRRERGYVARGDIERLKMCLETIQFVLPDAERRRETSAAVRVWINRVRDVLYDVDDLLDEILTLCAVNQQMEGSKIHNQVRDFFSFSNSTAYAYRVAARAKALRQSLEMACKDTIHFGFILTQHKEQMSVLREVPLFLDSKKVTGRNEEMNDILDFLLKEPSEATGVPVMAIVGIGGMGKTALAQLAYNHDFVRLKFKNRWWVSVPDTHEEGENLKMIYKAINHGNTYLESDGDRLTACIGESVREAGKYLLVIDGAWDENYTTWSKRMSLLRNGCAGSRIIVTTRSLLVARAMDAVKIQKLGGLSEDDSWELLKMIALTSEEEGDPKWESLGREIANKCSGVPLAIRRIGSHLHGRSMQEWEYFINEELSKIELSDNVVLSSLKLSYDAFPSELMYCFAYCALFPKGRVISKQNLVRLWIAQGFIEPSHRGQQTVEEIGNAYLNYLLSIFFLEEPDQDEFGETKLCKLNDLAHDLAQAVAGDEVIILTEHHSNRSQSARHASIEYDKFQSSEALSELRGVDRLRSCLFFKDEVNILTEHHSNRSQSARNASIEYDKFQSPEALSELDQLRLCLSFKVTGSCGSSPAIHQQLDKLHCLRALDLSGTGIGDVPRSIGGLKHLRYLNLSKNSFESLPDSMSKLFNLITLDISRCEGLKAWPKHMRRLINLRHLDYSHCFRLTQMPDGFGELTNLQHLSDFKPAGDRSMFEAFSKLRLKGELTMDFANHHHHHVQDKDDCWQLPATVKRLRIDSYLGESLPRWRDERDAAIVYLGLHFCENLKRLPALRMLRNLKTLVVNSIKELEYVEEDDDAETTSSSSPPCFPHLENLSLVRLPQLKGWSRSTVKLKGFIFPHLKRLKIAKCPGMELWGDGDRGVEWDSLSTLRTLNIRPMPTAPEILPSCLLQRNVQIL